MTETMFMVRSNKKSMCRSGVTELYGCVRVDPDSSHLMTEEQVIARIEAFPGDNYEVFEAIPRQLVTKKVIV